MCPGSDRKSDPGRAGFCLMPTPIFRGKIENGKICLDRRDEFAQHIASLNGKPVELILRREKAKRSSPQNSYYWAVVVKMLSEHCGYDSEEMHEALKWRFLWRDGGVEAGGSPLITAKSTASLSTKEFSEYVEQCRMLAAGMGVVIPGPGEVAA